MTVFKMLMALGLAATVSACGAVDIASRNAPFEDVPSTSQRTYTTQKNLAAQPSPVPAQILDQLSVAAINVRVPETLRVSEANRYYPSGDIVWREDPIGNRHAQVKAIFEAALATGTASLQGPVPVILDVEVERFHALTEKARYTVGGVHSIRFKLQLRDAQTGAPLSEPRVVQADLDGFGGQQALQAEARGLTQKVRISAHLAEVIRQELTRPEGYRNARLGFFQAINKL